jgi:hypothetical protein
MGSTCTAEDDVHRFELRFFSLGPRNSDFSIPCDASGAVDIDLLSESLRLRYLFARKVIGLEFGRPAVCPVAA